MSLPILREHARMVNPYDLHWCPAVTSLIGRDPTANSFVILPVRCKRWTCPYCRVPNEILLKEKVAAGHPTRMITLTVKPAPGETPTQTHNRVRPCISRLWQFLRHRVGELEAATFLELHKSGFPHWHALNRGAFIPHDLLRDKWLSLTGSYVVDIRQIKDSSVSRRYVQKYVVKQLARQIFSRVGRVVCFTRGYAPSPPAEPRPPMSWQRSPRHPIELAEIYAVQFDVAWAGRTATITPRSPDADAAPLIRFTDAQPN